MEKDKGVKVDVLSALSLYSPREIIRSETTGPQVGVDIM